MFLTRQPFVETPDGVRLSFTTSQPFVAGTLIVTQGGLVVSNFQYIETTGIVFDVAPDPANGTLLWSGDVADTGGIPAATNGFWTVADFRAVFDVSAGSDTAVAWALATADAKLKGFLTAEAYADAQLATPEDAARAILIRTVAGKLARLSLLDTGIVTGAIASKTESYRGVKTYAESYQSTTQSMTPAQSEGELLASLSQWEHVVAPTDATAAAGVVWWGTGRWPL